MQEQTETIRVTSGVTEILKEEYGVGTKIPVAVLAERIGIHEVMLNRFMDINNFSYILCCKLAKFFGTTPEFWWNLNNEHHCTWCLSRLRQEEIDAIVPWSDPV